MTPLKLLTVFRQGFIDWSNNLTLEEGRALYPDLELTVEDIERSQRLAQIQQRSQIVRSLGKVDYQDDVYTLIYDWVFCLAPIMALERSYSEFIAHCLLRKIPILEWLRKQVPIPSAEQSPLLAFEYCYHVVIGEHWEQDVRGSSTFREHGSVLLNEIARLIDQKALTKSEIYGALVFRHGYLRDRNMGEEVIDPYFEKLYQRLIEEPYT